MVGSHVYIGKEVKIGNCCKIQNHASLYKGSTIEDGVFVGPHCVLTNDKYPRAINKDGSLKRDDQWELLETYIEKGASLGAFSVIVAGVRIGRYAMIGAGSVVTHDVPEFTLAYGVPARHIAVIDYEGNRVKTFK